jgi:hypothetical protein
MLRKTVAIILGLVAGGIFNMALIQVSHVMYPLPEGIDPNDFEQFRAHVESHGMPTGALIVVLLAHAGGSLVSGLVCGLIAKRGWYTAAIALGLVWTAGGVAMLYMLPSPTWFAICDVLLYVPAALVGVVIGAAITGGSAQPVTPSS